MYLYPDYVRFNPDRTMKISREGTFVIALTAVIVVFFSTAAVLFLPCWAGIATGVILLILLGFVVAFYRVPRRPFVQEPATVYAPADGKIVAVEQIDETEYIDGRRIQVSVFMSITNVHVNWFPVSGKVVYFKHHHGKYMVAWHPKSSEQNERTATAVDTGRHVILFRQIAGYMARRIISYAQVGQPAQQNVPCGFIKFGSRVDLVLPPDAEILVAPGDRVVGSQTPVARLK